MIEEIELKPCPCCGGIALLDFCEIGYYYVRCFECDLQTGYYPKERDGKKLAARAWNKRADNITTNKLYNEVNMCCGTCADKSNMLKLINDLKGL